MKLQRVVPLLNVVATQSHLALTEDQRHQLRMMQGDAMVWAVRVEHRMLEAIRVLDDANIPCAVLKGLATAHLDYPDPSWRQVGDVDLLVDSSDFIRTLRMLEANGWEQGYKLPRGHLRFTHAVTLVRDHVELDLHQHIGHRAIGLLIPTAALLDKRVRYQIAGREVFALTATDRLIHASVHAHLSSGSTRRLSSVADVLVLAQQNRDAADEVLQRANGWSVARIVHAAIISAYETARIEVPESWRPSANHHIVASKPWVERVQLASPRKPWQQELAYLRVMNGWSDRVRYVAGHFAGIEGSRGLRAATTRVGYLWRKLL